MFKLFELCLVHCLLIQLYARFHFFFQDSVENMVESKEDMWCAFDVSLKFLVLYVRIESSGYLPFKIVGHTEKICKFFLRWKLKVLLSFRGLLI